MGMLYELDDIEKRALVMEIKPEIDPVDEARELLANAAQGPLTLIRYEHGGGRLYREEPRDLIADFYDAANRDFHFRAPELLNSLIARIEAQEEDKQLLGERSEVLANELSKVVAERNQLREALRPVPLLVEAAKGILNVHTWRGKKGYEAALRDGIRELQAAVKDVPDVAGMLLNLTALSPKGEQK